MKREALVVAGVDEAGRGPLAGPVFAACVVLDPCRPIAGLRDSKKLAPARRTMLAEAIRRSALAWSLGRAEVEEIDRLNIRQASLLAMARAVEALGLRPDRVLVDGRDIPPIAAAAEAVVGGDDLVPEIAAASILAKTARDAEMLHLHAAFPWYGFDRHKGYPTPEHLAALRCHGVSAAHRRSFAPVRALLAAQPVAEGTAGSDLKAPTTRS
ncbi:ribonuclease HII [Pelomicrobium methylotrophicum]|uniref:Ribonuclease HII n=1 Tax=Pelomicrobium methylotrophicum TaxID=2602750 RepID=A0A5C7EZ04_9PROT|nr:ribonuclease HII [Pelomicrobium methylotrophicum]TXF13661.1 ribonuclease HII [Pelomicrobium methylotrophicum]